MAQQVRLSNTRRASATASLVVAVVFALGAFFASAPAAQAQAGCAEETFDVSTAAEFNAAIGLGTDHLDHHSE